MLYTGYNIYLTNGMEANGKAGGGLEYNVFRVFLSICEGLD